MNINEMCQGRHRLSMCLRKPTVTVGGKPYCWQHDPARKREIARTKWETRKAEMAGLEAKINADIERKRLLKASGVANLSNADLETIIARGGMTTLLDS